MATTNNELTNNNEAPVRNIILIGGFFFIFGFISWINATLIPYLKIACELEEWQAYLVTFAFYISYTVMAIPSSGILKRSGMVKGMSIGLGTMAAGCLLFIPAALVRNYGIFLGGLFLTGAGLTLLQTAVNPYITLLGPARTAARRISMMGVCNKVAGILAPLIMGSIILSNSEGLIEQLAAMDPAAKKIRLDELARDVIVPYCIIAGILLILSVLIRFAHLPEIKQEEETVLRSADKPAQPSGITLAMTGGFLAIFCAVGAEVLAGDTIGNYGLYQGFDLSTSKTLASYTLACMMVGYIAGILAIPRFISQQKAFYWSSWLGLLLVVLILLLPGKYSIVCVALLGLGNAMLWPAIWPQALRGLTGAQLARGSAVLIMGIAGGALLPLLYGWLTGVSGNQIAYWILIPVYVFLIYYSFTGLKQPSPVRS